MAKRMREEQMGWDEMVCLFGLDETDDEIGTG